MTPLNPQFLFDGSIHAAYSFRPVNSNSDGHAWKAIALRQIIAGSGTESAPQNHDGQSLDEFIRIRRQGGKYANENH